MSPANLQARRATVDDLSALRKLWEMMRYPAADLERQLTDFQVVVDSAGTIVGAIGFQIAHQQGLVHTEAFEDFSQAEHARPVLWNRIQALCTNHGVVRLWLRDASPFWTHNGFLAATPATLEKLPEQWNRSQPGWLTLQLRDENVLASLDKEFALFVASEKQRSAGIIGQAKILKTLATVIAFLICIAIVAAAVYLYLAHRRGSLTPH